MNHSKGLQQLQIQKMLGYIAAWLYLNVFLPGVSGLVKERKHQIQN